MKNLNKLGLVFGFGTLVALCAGGCSSDSGSGNTAGTAGTTAGNSTGGTTAGASTGGAGASTGGAGASTGGAGASTGGGGSGGASGGTGGGGAGGVGGVGGAGGAGGGAGGGGGTGGGGPSADCMTWCVGDKGLPKVCMGSNLLNPLVDSVEKCLAECAKPANAAGLQCWITHTGFIKMPADQDPHCGHASGDPGKAAPCMEITQ